MTRKNSLLPTFHCAINSYSLLFFIFLLLVLNWVLLYLKVFPGLSSNLGTQALEGISWEILFLSC